MRTISVEKLKKIVAQIETKTIALPKLLSLLSQRAPTWQRQLDIKRLLSVLECNESVTLPQERYNSIRASCTKYSNAWGVQFTCRSTKEGVRITRIK